MATLYDTLNRVALFLSRPARAVRACSGQVLSDERGGLTAASRFSRPDPGLGVARRHRQLPFGSANPIRGQLLLIEQPREVA
jgi:hypothetical protein